MMKKILAALLCGVMLLSASLSAGASSPEETTPVQEDIQPRLSFTNGTNSTLSFAGHMATCVADFKGVPGKTTAVWITMRLEKKTLWWWSEVVSWNKYFQQVNANYNLAYPVDGGGTYRLVCEFTAYGGSATESVTKISEEKKIS